MRIIIQDMGLFWGAKWYRDRKDTITVPFKGCSSAAPLARWFWWPGHTQKSHASLTSHDFGSPAQPYLSPCGRAPTKERNLFLQLLRSRDSVTQNSPRDHGFASCRKVCLLLGFVEKTDANSCNHSKWWILGDVLHQHGLPLIEAKYAIRITDVMSGTLQP